VRDLKPRHVLVGVIGQRTSGDAGEKGRSWLLNAMFPSFSQFLAIQTSMILVKKIQWISNFFLYLEHHGDITL